MNNKINREMNVMVCKDHIGGLLGEAILKFFLKEKLILRNENDEYNITDKGWDDLELIGIDIDELKFSYNKAIKICIERENGILFEHIGSKLGSLIYNRFFELDWFKKIDDKKIVMTNKGILGLTSLGIKIKRYNFA